MPVELRINLTVQSVAQPELGQGQVIFNDKGYYIVSFKGTGGIKDRAKEFVVTEPKGIEEWIEQEKTRRETEGYTPEATTGTPPSKGKNVLTRILDVSAMNAPPFSPQSPKPTAVTRKKGSPTKKFNLNSFHWFCSKCTLQNSIKRRLCSICMSPRTNSCVMSGDMRSIVEYVNSVVDRCVSTEDRRCERK